MSADMLNAVTLIRFPPVENETRFDKRLRGDVLVSEDDLWCGGAQQTVGFIGGLRRRTHEGSLMETEGMSNPNSTVFIMRFCSMGKKNSSPLQT